MRLPAEPKPEALVAIVDTREQTPVNLSPLQSIRGTLATGDYSLVGLDSVVAIERKSLGDLLGCIGGSRERFEREIRRLLAYPARGVVVECSWSDIQRGGWRSEVTPAAAVGSILGWQLAGVPFLFVGDHAAAGRTIGRMLYIVARRRWRERGRSWQGGARHEPEIRNTTDRD